MTPEPDMSPEDLATFAQLSAAMGAEVHAAPAGPAPAEQLAALRQAVSQRNWFWAAFRARFG